METLGRATQWGLTAEQLDRLGWTNERDVLEQLIHTEYHNAFKWRSILPLLPTDDDPDSIFDYKFAARSAILNIPSQPRLVAA